MADQKREHKRAAEIATFRRALSHATLPAADLSHRLEHSRSDGK